jgi:hypothetical protein
MLCYVQLAPGAHAVRGHHTIITDMSVPSYMLCMWMSSWEEQDHEEVQDKHTMHNHQPGGAMPESGTPK